MSAILEGTPDKRLVLVTGRAYPELAEKVAECLGTEILETTSYDFANGEMYVRFTEPVRGADVFVLQCHSGDINKWIMEQLIMIDALKRASAKSITVVAPFLGYSRQDKKHRGREPITARLIFDLFHAAGADRIMTVDLHAAQEQGFFDGPVDHLTAMPVLLDYVRSTLDLGNTTIVSPDAGRIKVSEQWAAKLGNLPLAFIHKQRDITRPNHAEHMAYRRCRRPRLRGHRRHGRYRRYYLRSRAHPERIRRQVGDAGRHPWPALRPGRGAPVSLRRA